MKPSTNWGTVVQSREPIRGTFSTRKKIPTFPWNKAGNTWWINGWGNPQKWEKEGEVLGPYPPGLELNKMGAYGGIVQKRKPEYFWGLGYTIGNGE